MTPWCFCVGSARFACSAKKNKINPKYEQTQNTNPKYERNPILKDFVLLALKESYTAI